MKRALVMIAALTIVTAVASGATIWLLQDGTMLSTGGSGIIYDGSGTNPLPIAPYGAAIWWDFGITNVGGQQWITNRGYFAFAPNYSNQFALLYTPSVIRPTRIIATNSSPAHYVMSFDGIDDLIAEGPQPTWPNISRLYELTACTITIWIKPTRLATETSILSLSGASGSARHGLYYRIGDAGASGHDYMVAEMRINSNRQWVTSSELDSMDPYYGQWVCTQLKIPGDGSEWPSFWLNGRKTTPWTSPGTNGAACFDNCNQTPYLGAGQIGFSTILPTATYYKGLMSEPFIVPYVTNATGMTNLMNASNPTNFGAW